MADITPERIAELRGACKDQCRDPRCDCMDSLIPGKHAPGCKLYEIEP